MSDKNIETGFKRIVEADNQVVTEYNNDVYDFKFEDNITSVPSPSIKLKSSDKNIIIKQLIADLSYTNNRINVIMTLIDQFCYSGIIPEEVMHALEQTLNTEDRRNYKQK